jgi:hypothetical protein
LIGTNDDTQDLVILPNNKIVLPACAEQESSSK